MSSILFLRLDDRLPFLLLLSVFPWWILDWIAVRWHSQQPAVLSQGRRGHRELRAFCVKLGAGSTQWKFPVKSCDRLAERATQKELS